MYGVLGLFRGSRDVLEIPSGSQWVIISTIKMPMMLDLLLSDKIVVMLCEFVVVGGGWLAVDTHIGFYCLTPPRPPPKNYG